MTAREYFEGARSAQRRIDGRLASIQSMVETEAQRAQRYDAIVHGSGISDPMARVDARIDAEARARAELADLEAAVDDARQVCAGIRRANPNQPFWGDALEHHYIDLMTWAESGSMFGVSAETMRRAAYSALDWVDAVGIAAAREGMGQAALF